MDYFELIKKLGKAQLRKLSGKVAKTKHNLQKKNFLGDFKNRRCRLIYRFILTNYSDKGHLEPGKSHP